MRYLQNLAVLESISLSGKTLTIVITHDTLGVIIANKYPWNFKRTDSKFYDNDLEAVRYRQSCVSRSLGEIWALANFGVAREVEVEEYIPLSKGEREKRIVSTFAYDWKEEKWYTLVNNNKLMSATDFKVDRYDGLESEAVQKTWGDTYYELLSLEEKVSIVLSLFSPCPSLEGNTKEEFPFKKGNTRLVGFNNKSIFIEGKSLAELTKELINELYTYKNITEQ